MTDSTMDQLMAMKNELDHYGDFHQEPIDTHYNILAKNYEKMMYTMGHPDPEICAKIVKKHCQPNPRIIDFGCGTGCVGKELIAHEVT